MQAKIEEAFKREAEIDARHISVAVSDHTARLYGHVHSLNEAYTAKGSGRVSARHCQHGESFGRHTVTPATSGWGWLGDGQASSLHCRPHRTAAGSARGAPVKLSRDHDPGYTGQVTRPQATALLAEGVRLLAKYQDRLAAQDTSACCWSSRDWTPSARTAPSST